MGPILGMIALMLVVVGLAGYYGYTQGQPK
jgi:hypothetical protein